MSGQVMAGNAVMREAFHAEESRHRQQDGQRHGDMTPGQMRWLIVTLLFLAWVVARSVLRWWPQLLG
jgi:hypothetical protein